MKCPEGHESTATDYCDVCGAVMGESSGGAPAPEAPAAPEPTPADDGGGDADTRECPNCSAAGPVDALFCEACGYDYTTGTMPRAVNALDLDAPATSDAPSDANPLDADDASGPVAAPAVSRTHDHSGSPEPDPEATITRTALSGSGAPAAGPADSTADPADSADAAPADLAAAPSPAEAAPAPGDAAVGGSAGHSSQADNPSATLSDPWLAEVWIDPAWYRDQGSPDPMPSPGPPDLIVLTKSSLLVGRESTSRGITPDIDCGVDNGVSRRHAQLTTDGTRWWVEDLDSANGVWIGDVVGELPKAPIPARSKREFSGDDRLYVGSWTRIVVRKATQDEVDALA